MKKSCLKAFVFIITFIFITNLGLLAKVEPELLSGLKARSIGPSSMSGRIGAVDSVASNPDIIYVGAATGGLWKSTDAGFTWEPVFDDQPVSSIGAIAINQSNPNIVWVGTGEAAPRNSCGVGRGVYLSADAGKNWKFLGLEKTEKISKILLDPNDPDTAYVAALGTTWGENPERGVFKTIDAGKTWEKVLYVNEKTGAADMAMAPDNPNKIIAALWEHRRWPWFFKSGGPGSGLYLTVNGGKDWKKLTDKDGLPKGELGRIGIAFSANKPQIVYALVEAKDNVLLRSEDGGYSWHIVNNKEDVSNRPFYYQRIWVNPVNENIMYMLHSRMMVSEDGGKTFINLPSFSQAHSDFHALWIHPDGERMIAGNDGGVVISINRGKTWRFVENLPIGQFYHVSFDMEIPYNLYGGLQDNGSWIGQGYALKERGIYNYLWKTVGGGDGFDTEPDPEKKGGGYGMSQGGNLYYFDISTGTSRDIVPTESDVKHRYNWNAGFAVDPFDPKTIYLGSQFVHRSKDKGLTWEIISSDLTSNDPEKQKQAESGGLTLDVTNAENHTTIMCIAPSPLQEGVIWVGTDDGNLQLTRDGGETWQLVSKELTSGKKGMVPPCTWIPHVEASKFDAARAYVVFDDHRRANWTPYIFVTNDFGKTWKSLSTPEIDGFCHVVEEDTVNENLLFLGTEFGLFITFDTGKSWIKWTHGLPTVPVRDLAVHPRENDLIIATHGRSLYILDDISPLREISEQVIEKKLHLFKVPDATQFQRGSLTSFMCPGDTTFMGENKRFGACITYYLTPSEKKGQEPQKTSDQTLTQRRRPETSASRVSILIGDKDGNQVAEMKGTEEKGINRVYWNFRETTAADSEESGRSRYRRGGMEVLPGEYKVTIKYGDQEEIDSFEIKTDPRFDIDLDVLKQNYTMGKKAQKLTETITQATTRIEETQKALKVIQQNIQSSENENKKELLKEAENLEKRLKELSEILDPTPAKQGISDLSSGLRRQVMSAVWGIMGAGYRPITQASQVKYEKAKTKLNEFLENFNSFFQEDIKNFKKLLSESDFSLLKTYESLRIKEEKEE